MFRAGPLLVIAGVALLAFALWEYLQPAPTPPWAVPGLAIAGVAVLGVGLWRYWESGAFDPARAPPCDKWVNDNVRKTCSEEKCPENLFHGPEQVTLNGTVWNVCCPKEYYAAVEDGAIVCVKQPRGG